MEILYATDLELSVPLSQITLLLTLTTLALLFGKMKVALLTNYLFTLYWGFIFNREVLINSTAKDISNFTFTYFGFGLVIVILALLGFLTQQN